MAFTNNLQPPPLKEEAFYMDQQELIPHLFRMEFRKITSVLCKTFGIAHIEMAEDIASETFLSALETWPYRGIPENPVAWLYTVAKNKARNFLKRQQLFSTKVTAAIKQETDEEAELEIDLTDQNIQDSQLEMLFAICHPTISVEGQIGLALRILCGFGIDEIANAFLSSKETINKRLYRAREKLREEKIPIEFPGDDHIQERLDAVLRTLYLVFNEGYYSETSESILREEFCMEAMRLNYQLIENEKTSKPAVNALMALMCFHASRFEARKNEHGEMILYQDQDETLWNQDLIAKGAYFLQQSTKGDRITKYHLEAQIAWWHTIKEDRIEKWENILQLYNHLLQIEYSPIAALNRTFALSKANGKEEAIREAEKLKLEGNHFYFVLLGELYQDIDREKSVLHYEKALSVSNSEAERKVIRGKIEKLIG
jgi:RNA polymerase sigma-70 factor (ECF subfamily)